MPPPSAPFSPPSVPRAVIVAAARVGGIKANADRPVEFLLENLKIQNNLIESAHHSGVGKLLFLGSSCNLPEVRPPAHPETALLTGELEPTNEPYAIAKIAGISSARPMRGSMETASSPPWPTNLYGPGDNFDLDTSHVLPALIRKVHEAKSSGASEVCIWGTGTPRREFLHVHDLARACRFLLENTTLPRS